MRESKPKAQSRTQGSLSGAWILSVIIVASFLIRCSSKPSSGEPAEESTGNSMKVDSATLISYCIELPSEYALYDAGKRKKLLQTTEILEDRGYISGSMHDVGEDGGSSSFVDFSIKQVSSNFVIANWKGIGEGADFGYSETEVFRNVGGRWERYGDALAEVSKSSFFEKKDDFPDWPHSIEITFTMDQPFITAELVIGASDPYYEQMVYESKSGTENHKYDTDHFLIDAKYLSDREKASSSKFSKLILVWNDQQSKFTITERIPNDALTQEKLYGTWYKVSTDPNTNGYVLTKNCGGDPLTITISGETAVVNPGQIASQYRIIGFRNWGTSLHVIMEDGEPLIFQVTLDKPGIALWRNRGETGYALEETMVHEKFIDEVTVKNVNEGCEGS